MNSITASTNATGQCSAAAAHARRLTFVCALAAAELLTVSWLFSFGEGIPRWSNPVFILRQALLAAILALAAFIVLVWPQRAAILDSWHARETASRFRAAFAVNLGLLAALVPATMVLTDIGAQADTPPWHLFWAYSVLLLATGASLLTVHAPLRFWFELTRRHFVLICGATASALAAQLASLEAQAGWEGLAGATLALSSRLLSVFDPGVVVDTQAQRITLHQFWVIIDQTCSGYEGIALVAIFLSLYLVAFRNELAFPAAFLLLPLGIAAIWLLNAVRIALLVLIGAYISPDIALKGFHSQAGWLSFLLVTICIMTIGHRIALFRQTPSAQLPQRAEDRQALAMLAPFMALMIGHIAMATFAPHGEWLLTFKLAGIAMAIWLFRDVYRVQLGDISILAVFAGLGVGIVWVATDPGRESGAKLAEFLAGEPAAAAGAWLVMRVVVGVLLVPVAEELAFRGFLYRFLADRSPVAFGTAPWSIAALVLSSLLFGLLHERWLVASISGVIFALLMLRSSRLSDAIAAHIAANAVVVGWALLAGQWSLL